MSRTNARRIPVALAFAILLALPVRPAAAANLESLGAPAHRSAERLWHWLMDLWESAAGRTETPGVAPARPGHTNVHGKLGGFIDPNGVRFLSQTKPETEILP
jgi:hypothetical protein